MSRGIEEVTVQDLIDESFGPIEYAIDRALYHFDGESEQARTTAEVRDWSERVERAMIGRNMSWIPYADEWPNEDEPDECLKLSVLPSRYIHFGTMCMRRARVCQGQRGSLKR